MFRDGVRQTYHTAKLFHVGRYGPVPVSRVAQIDGPPELGKRLPDNERGSLQRQTGHDRGDDDVRPPGAGAEHAGGGEQNRQIADQDLRRGAKVAATRNKRNILS